MFNRDVSTLPLKSPKYPSGEKQQQVLGSVPKMTLVALTFLLAGGQVQAQEGCGEDFSAALAACESASCRFVHPLTGEPMEQRVIGFDGSADACRYEQQMPSGGKMECRFDEADRQAMAAFFNRLARAETVGTSASMDLGSGETTTSHRINGEQAENPLAAAMASGRCRISGYEQQ